MMKQHYDSRVRDFCKLFKTDIKAKSNLMKTEGFASTLMKDLQDLDASKEASLVSRTVLKRNGIDNSILGKRPANQEASFYEPMGRKVKLGERFENHDDLFGLD